MYCGLSHVTTSIKVTLIDNVDILVTVYLSYTFRTSQQKTLSLHLFNVVVVVDRIIPTARGVENSDELKTDIKLETFIPSIEEQTILMDELVFHFATSVIKGVPQMKAEFANIYPAHLTHPYSAQAGEKTKQVIFQ